MMRLLRFITQWLIAAALLSACASLRPGAEPPRVSLADLHLQEFGLIEQRFALTLRIQNPNPFDIPLEGLSYTLEVNDAVFAEGVARPQASVPGYGEALVETAAVSNLGSLLKQLEQVPQQQGVRYRIRGRIDIGGIGGLLPFEHSGEIALPSAAAGAHSVRR